MGSIARYWTLVQLDARGICKTKVMAQAQVFLQQQPNLTAADISDIAIQRQLLSIVYQKSADSQIAELCLRCFISHQIQQVCLRLEFQFGSNHGFSRTDLFGFVLDDTGTRQPSTYEPLTKKILQTFNPERSSLANWTTRLVRHHPELNKFLLECGVYLVSDWAILNDTSAKQLARILTEHHYLTPVEVQQAKLLLQSYHSIYRQDRVQQRQEGNANVKRLCSPPTVAQLEKIAQTVVQAKAGVGFKPAPTEEILKRLQTLATQLRQYRICVRRGSPTTASLDHLTDYSNLNCFQSPDDILSTEQQNAQVEFLQSYRQQAIDSLDRAVEQAIQDRYKCLHQSGNRAEQFIQALKLLYCQRYSMSEIANAVGLKAQFQVSRLLQLKQLRADVKSRLLEALHSYVIDQARAYTEPELLQTLCHPIAAALDEQISLLVQQAEQEASVPTKYPLQSLLAQRIRYYLNTIPEENVPSNSLLMAA